MSSDAELIPDTTFGADLTASFVFPFQVSALLPCLQLTLVSALPLIVAVVLGLGVAIVGMVVLVLGSAAAFMVITAHFLRVVRATAAGQDDVPRSGALIMDFSDVALSVIALIPFVVFALLVRWVGGYDGLELEERAFVISAMFLFAFLTAPAVCVQVAGLSFNILYTFQMIATFPLHYAALMVTLFTTMLLGGAISFVSQMIAMAISPILWVLLFFLYGPIQFLVLTVMARQIGLLGRHFMRRASFG